MFTDKIFKSILYFSVQDLITMIHKTTKVGNHNI